MLRVTHELPTRSHLREDKTWECFLARLFLARDQAGDGAFCQSCPECQLAYPRHPLMAPLVTMPLMEELFEQVAVDNIGSLP